MTVYVVRCDPDETSHEGFIADNRYYETREGAELAKSIANDDVGVCSPHTVDTLDKGWHDVPRT